jgi:hypothetical protein
MKRTADQLEELLVRPAVTLALLMLESQRLQPVVDHQLAGLAEALDATLALVVGDGHAALVAVGPLQICRRPEKNHSQAV